MRRSTYYFFTLLLTALFLLPWSGVKATVTISQDSPYSNNFDTETNDALPTGWTSDGTGGSAWVDTKTNINTRNSSAKALRISANRGKNYIAILPEFSDDIQYLTISFYPRKGSNNATYSVGFYKDGTYTLKQTFSATTSYPGTAISYTFDNTATSGALIAIRVQSTETSGSKKSTLDIDDVTVTTSYVAPAGGCPKPNNLTKSADTPEGATFSWEQNDSEDTYQWACVAAGTEVTSWNTLAKDVREVTVDGLTAGTAYDFHARSYCGDGEGEQSASAKINFTPTCPAPTYGANPVSDKTHNSATVTWNAATGITKYQYVCVLKNATPDWTGVEAKEVISANVTGLSGQTDYDFYVRSWYSATAQSTAAKTSFQTECGPKSLPFDEAFSSIGCWSTVDANGSTGISSSTFKFNYDKNKTQYLISPELIASEKQLQVEFKYWVQSATYPESFRIGYSTTDKELASFTWKEEQTNLTNTSSNKLTYSEVLPAGVKYVTIHYTALDQYALFIDDFSATEYVAPACANPTGLSVGEIETTSAQVTWTSDASEFALEYKKTADENWTAATGTVASPFTLNNLEPNETEYTVRVKAICGETPSDWVELAQPFKTDCEAKSIGWSENFDAAALRPACWSSTNMGNTAWSIYGYDAHSGSNTARCTAYKNNSSLYADLITPDIDLSNPAQLKFYYIKSSSNVTAQVLIRIAGEDDAIIWTASTKSSWAAKPDSIDLRDYTGNTAKLIFRVYGSSSSSSSYFYLDDVSVTELPCEAPTNLTVATGATTATLAWESNETAWNLQYKAEGEENWTEEAVNTKSFKLTNLTVATNYQAKVQSACGGDFAEISFSTWCDATDVAAWPIDQTFANVPECWTSATTTPLAVESNYLFITGVTEQIAVLPLYNIDLNKLSVTLTYATSGALDLGYMNESDEYVTLGATLASGTEIELASAPAEPTRLAIKYTGANANSASISRVYIRKTPTCLKPVISPVDADKESAEITWTGSNAEKWNLQYKTGSFDWTTVAAITENPYTLEGLAQGTTYSVRVQGACSDEDSDWSEVVDFTTDCDVIAALPFAETFDAALSNCWKIYDDNTTYYPAQVYDGALRLPGGKTGAGHVVVLPQITASLAKASFTVNYSATVYKPEVGYVTDPLDASTFAALEELSISSTATTAYVALATVPENAHIAFRYAGTGTSEGNCYIYDIRVSRVEVFYDSENNQDRFADLVNEAATIDDLVLNRTLLFNGDYNTLCLPFSLSAEQLADEDCPLHNFKIKAFDLATIENEELLIAIADASDIQAGVPYFVAFQGENTPADAAKHIFHNVTIATSAPGNVAKGDLDYQGVFNPVDLAAQTGDTHNQLFLAAGNKIYWPAQNKTVKGFRAYFNVNLSETGPLQIKAGMPVRMVERTGVATGCENVNAAGAKAVKLLENGQVVIIRNGIKYTIQGQIISK